MFSSKTMKTLVPALCLVSAPVFAGNNFDKAYQSFDTQTLKQDIKKLSSDEFGGREPSSKEEPLTTNMLIDGFKALGLEPGNNGSYTQAVPMVSITGTPTKNLTIGDISFEFPKNYVASSRKMSEVNELKDSEIVFVGYGINAPEFFDKGVFTAMFNTLKQQKYLDNDGNCDTKKTQQFARLLFTLLYPEVKLTIEESIHQLQS